MATGGTGPLVFIDVTEVHGVILSAQINQMLQK